MIRLFGEDPEREGLRKTPERYEKALKFLTSGYHQNIDLVERSNIQRRLRRNGGREGHRIFQLVRTPPAAFLRKAHVAYLPNKKGSRSQQNCAPGEHVCSTLADSGAHDQSDRRIHRGKNRPQGVGVIIEARHLCMQMRGVEKQHGQAVTSAMLGAFRQNKQTRDEFLSLVRNQKS